MGVIVLVARFLGEYRVASIVPSLPPLTANMAFCLVLIGVTLALVGHDRKRWFDVAGMVLSVALGIFAISMIAEESAGLDFGIDQLIARNSPLGGGGLHPGRIPPLPAFTILLIAAGMLLLHQHKPIATGLAGWVGCVLAGISLAGIAVVIPSALGSSFSGRIGIPTPLSIPGTVSLALVSASFLGWSIAAYGVYPAHRRFRRQRMLLVAIMTGFAFAALFVWLGLAYMATLTITESLEAEATSGARLLDEYTERTLDAGYLMIDRTADMVEEHGFDHVASSLADWLKISTMARTSPQINSIVLIDATGRVRMTSTEFPLHSTGTDASGRDYFKAHRDHGSTIFLGSRIRTANTHLDAFTVSQGIVDENGKFGGLVLATIKVATFEGFFSSLNLPKDVGIGVFRDGGELLTGSAPGLPNFAGDVFANMGPGATGRSLWLPGNGVRRFITYRRLADRPILVASEVVLDNLMELWRSNEARTAPGIVAAFILLFLASWVWIGHIHREETHHLQLEELATTDPLTQTANRRAFIDNARREISRAQRFKAPLSLLLIDADHFKRINDDHGHAAGDQVLTVLAAICRTHLRNIDTIGRIGGEEFAVTLPRTDLSGALIVAEKIRAACANTAIAVPAGTISLTVSIGVAQLESGMDDIAELMQAADTRLYKAKGRGRNQVYA